MIPDQGSPDRFSPDKTIQEALDSLRLAREFLLDPSPRNLDCSQMAMGQCAVRLAALIGDPAISAGSSTSVLASMGEARRELSTIASLLNSAASYRRGLWQAMRSAAGTPVISEEVSSEKVQRVHVLC